MCLGWEVKANSVEKIDKDVGCRLSNWRHPIDDDKNLQRLSIKPELHEEFLDRFFLLILEGERMVVEHNENAVFAVLLYCSDRMHVKKFGERRQFW